MYLKQQPFMVSVLGVSGLNTSARNRSAGHLANSATFTSSLPCTEAGSSISQD